MKTSFKKFTAFMLLMLAFIGLALSASAQQYNVTALSYTNGGATYLDGGTNHIPAAATNTLNSPITLTRYDQMAIQLVFKLNGSGTSATVWNFDHSADGTNYTTGALALSLSANGTTAVTITTNITVNATGYWRLRTVENPNASAITNLQVMVWKKPSRYGN